MAFTPVVPPILGTTADVVVASANADAVITYSAAGAGISNAITGVAWSYNGVPTTGRLTVADGSNVIFDIDITTAGPGVFTFPFIKKGTANTAMTIKLFAGGSNVVGKVNALGFITG
jgi:hypothetical protein